MPRSHVKKITPYSDGKRRKMKMTKLTAVALTAHGANPEANVTFFKSHDKPAELSKVIKKAIMVSNNSGHTHLIFLSPYIEFEGAGYTSWSEGHDHPFVIDEEGDIRIGMSYEHDHYTTETILKIIEDEDSLNSAISNFDFEDDNASAMASLIEKSAEILKLDKAMPTSGSLFNLISKNAASNGGGQEHKEDKTMPKDNNAEQAAKDLLAMKAKLATAEALATLSDSEKAFYAKLDDSGKESFLTKSAEERLADIEVVKSANAVVYKSADGSEYFKNDDPRLVSMAKQADLDSAKLAKVQAVNVEITYKSRAAKELANLPGTVETHVNLLKSIDAIKDPDARKDALKVLTAQNESFAPAHVELGTSADPVNKGAADANDELETLAKKHVKENPDVNYFDAYGIVSEAHPELYNKAVGA